MNNRDEKWWFQNLANLITSIGVALCAALLYVIVFHREQVGGILVLSTGVLMTDFLDGQVARRLKIVSQLGAALDRLRDKAFQFEMFLFFLLDPRIGYWLKVATVPLVLAELLLLGTWVMEAAKSVDVSAGIWGKWKMTIMSGGIIAVPVVIWVRERGVRVPHCIEHVLTIILVVSCVLAIMSLRGHIAKIRTKLYPSRACSDA